MSEVMLPLFVVFSSFLVLGSVFFILHRRQKRKMQILFEQAQIKGWDIVSDQTPINEMVMGKRLYCFRGKESNGEWYVEGLKKTQANRSAAAYTRWIMPDLKLNDGVILIVQNAPGARQFMDSGFGRLMTKGILTMAFGKNVAQNFSDLTPVQIGSQLFQEKFMILSNLQPEKIKIFVESVESVIMSHTFNAKKQPFIAYSKYGLDVSPKEYYLDFLKLENLVSFSTQLAEKIRS